jgi:hypothetical protein
LGCNIPFELLYKAAADTTRIVVIETQSSYEAKYLEHIRSQQAPSNLTFDITRSECVLSWKFFNQSSPVPLFLEMIPDHNLGRFSSEMSQEVVAALNNRLPMDLSNLEVFQLAN